MEQMQKWLPLIQQIVEILLPLVATLVAWALRQWVVTKLAADKRAMLIAAAEGAYWVVEQVARKTPGKLDDKVAAALRVVADEMKRPLQPGEAATVANAVKALHEQERGVGAATVKNTQ